MGTPGIIFLAIMTLLAGKWCSTRYAAENNLIGDFTHIICKTPMLADFEAALADQAAKHALLVAKNRPGIQGEEERKKENVMPLRGPLDRARKARPGIHKLLMDLHFEAESKKQRITDKIIQRTYEVCPEVVTDQEKSRGMLRRFLNTYMKIYNQ